MKKNIITFIIILFIQLIFAEDSTELYIKYNTKLTEKYFKQTLSPAAKSDKEEVKEIIRLMQIEVDELISKDWGVWYMYSRPVNEDEARFVYMNKPDELFTALYMAHPFLNDDSKVKVKAYALDYFSKYKPYITPWHFNTENFRGTYVLDDKVRNGIKNGWWVKEEAINWSKFRTLYSVWAYTETFEQWETVKKDWEEIKKLKEKVNSYTWLPQWRKQEPSRLIKEIAENEEYRFRLKYYWRTGTHGTYGSINHYPYDQGQDPYVQYSYPQILSALIGYGRIAKKMQDEAEYKWAVEKFNLVAQQAFQWDSSPKYWASPWLVPEVARMLKDNAADYIETVKKTGDVFAGDTSKGYAVDGPDYRVLDPFHWYLQHAGSNGAFPPCAPMSGFLMHALCLDAAAEELDKWIDIPLCKADYWYIQKCAVAMYAYNKFPVQDLWK